MEKSHFLHFLPWILNRWVDMGIRQKIEWIYLYLGHLYSITLWGSNNPIILGSAVWPEWLSSGSLRVCMYVLLFMKWEDTDDSTNLSIHRTGQAFLVLGERQLPSKKYWVLWMLWLGCHLRLAIDETRDRLELPSDFPWRPYTLLRPLKPAKCYLLTQNWCPTELLFVVLVVES